MAAVVTAAFALIATALQSKPMLMKSAIAIAVAALFATTTWAQSSSASLDLQVPPAQDTAAAPASKASDEPGQYYGDVNGNGAAQSDTQVSGSFSSGIGYAKGFGTGFSSAADLNVSKRTDEGNLMSLHIGVSQSRGFAPYRYGAPWNP